MSDVGASGSGDVQKEGSGFSSNLRNTASENEVDQTTDTLDEKSVKGPDMHEEETRPKDSKTSQLSPVKHNAEETKQPEL